MSRNFRIEHANRAVIEKYLKVIPKNDAVLPLEIDRERRFAYFFVGSESFLDGFHNFEVREDDIWVVTLPKCGTTWMLELVWLLVHDLDYETGFKVNQEDRCPFLEYCAIFPKITPTSIEIADRAKSPRVIKTHLPMHMLPKGLWTVKPKIIYVAREPKDVAVSLYHFMGGMGRTLPSKEQFLNTILKNETSCYPFWTHVVEFWKLRKEPYIYFTSFERMMKDLRSIVLEVSEFLDKSIDDQHLETLLDHMSFENMKRNPACNHLKDKKKALEIRKSEANRFNFIRKGVVGSQKEDLTDNTIKEFEEWTDEALTPYGVTSGEILYS